VEQGDAGKKVISEKERKRGSRLPLTFLAVAASASAAPQYVKAVKAGRS
jgi:hypothetical protein